MTLGEMKLLIERQLDNAESFAPFEIKLALGWALDSLASKAAEASGPRMLYEFRIDKDPSGIMRLPVEVKVIKEVWDDTNPDTPVGYSRISYPSQTFLDEAAAMAWSATLGGCVWWQVHRDLHIRPKPASNSHGKLRVGAYARPPLPGQQEEEVAIPFEAERWVIAKAASLILPHPSKDALEIIRMHLGDSEKDLNQWLWNHSASVPPAPMESGELI